MIGHVIAELGPWNWIVLGLVLVALEIVAPGVFLLWIGIAALIVGAISVLVGEAAYWTWQIQAVVFVVLAVISAYVGKTVAGARAGSSDQPLLNRRGAQMIGRMATLSEPIRNGRGRIRLGDTLWRVSGPDLPVGAKVRVTGAADTDLELTVEAVH